MKKTAGCLLVAGAASLFTQAALAADSTSEFDPHAPTTAKDADTGRFNNTSKAVPDISSLLLYGKVETGFMYGNSDAGVKNREMWNGTSYWGLRGTESLGGRTTAFFFLESGFKLLELNIGSAVSFLDDGPNANTLAVLDVLKAQNVKATFFIVGRMAKAHPEILARIAAEGHLLANHSATHAFLGKRYVRHPEELIAQIRYVDNYIRPLMPANAKFYFRAPYGAWNAKLVDIVGKEQFDFFQWDVDSLDWKGLSSEQMQARVFPRVVSGSIILFHNDGEHTPEVMPVILEKLIADGYKPVTVTELLGESLEAAKKGD